MKRSLLCLCILVFMSTGISLNALAVQDATGQAVQEVGKKIAFQGTLYENGEPVTGERNFTFSIEIDENTTWTETQENVSIVEGLYSVALGSVSPIPIDLFYGVEERELTVSLGSTVLGTTILYAPFSSNSSEQGNFIMETKSDNDSTAINAEISGNLGKSFNTAISATAKTDSTNIAVYGASEASEANEKFQYGMWGESTSNNPNAWAHGVIGIGRTNGATAYGVRGQVAGSGSAFSAAMRGLNFIDATNGGIRYGGYFNTYNREGSPFDGESVGARGNGGGSLANTGVIGEGFGAGDLNIGVKGIANGAAENWAGWFEGEVRSTGQMVVRNNEESTSKFTIADIQALAHGPDEEVNAIMGMNWLDGGDQAVNRGALFIFGDTTERFNREGADIRRAELTAMDNGVNGGSVGNFRLRSFDGDMFKAGIETREDGFNSGELRMASSNGFDFARLGLNGQNAGSLELRSAVDSISVLIDSNGEKAGYMALYDSLGRTAMDMFAYPGNASQLRMFAPTPDKEGADLKAQTSVSAQYVGGGNPFINLIGRNADGSAIGRTQMGRLSGFNGTGLRITDGNFRWLATMQGDETNGGSITLEGPSTSNFWLGQKNWENSDLPYMALRGAQGVDDGNGGSYIPDGLTFEVTGYNDGSENGLINFTRVFEGQSQTIGLDYSTLNDLVNPSRIRVAGANGNEIAVMQGDETNGGSINLEGPSTSNFWLGQKSWEDSNLPYMSMIGVQSLQDANGNDYVPNGLTFEIATYGDGTENGLINFYRTENGESKVIGMDYSTVNDLVNPTAVRVNGENGNEVASLQRRGNNFGQAQFFNENTELRAEIGSFGDNSGFMQLYAPNGNKNLQLGGSDGNREFGMLKLFDNNGQDMFQLDAEDNNGNFVPYFRMGNPQNVDENNYPKDAIRFGLSSDNNGDGKYSSYFNMEGPDAPLIQMGSRGWESNDGSNRARIALFGSDEESDGNGGTYTPERASISISKDDGNNEYGTLNLTNTTGGGFEVGARGWEDNSQGGYLTYTAIRSTVDVDDGNGGTYRPWLVSQEFHQDGSGNQFGTIRISSTDNTGFANINDGNTGNIDISGSFNQSSDRRLKKNIKTLTSGLSIVNQLRGVRYNWKDESRAGNKIGFVAQEVEEILPELVKTNENGFKGVNYAEMTAVLVEAVKELSKQIDELKSENASLKAEASKVQSLEERLSRIEALLTKPATVNADQK